MSSNPQSEGAGGLTGSLRGLVLPIGGVKEKVLASQRAGLRVVLPAHNRRDLEDIPADARSQLEFVWLEQVDDALEVALSIGAAGGVMAQHGAGQAHRADIGPVPPRPGSRAISSETPKDCATGASVLPELPCSLTALAYSVLTTAH